VAGVLLAYMAIYLICEGEKEEGGGGCKHASKHLLSDSCMEYSNLAWEGGKSMYKRRKSHESMSSAQ